MQIKKQKSLIQEIRDEYQAEVKKLKRKEISFEGKATADHCPSRLYHPAFGEGYQNLCTHQGQRYLFQKAQRFEGHGERAGL